MPVYNFEVEGYHSYFVAARGTRGPPVLVHNADETGCGLPEEGAGGAKPEAAIQLRGDQLPAGNYSPQAVSIRQSQRRAEIGINCISLIFSLEANSVKQVRIASKTSTL